MDLDRNALDRWITNGRYERLVVDVECKYCGNEFMATQESEYGGVTLNPEECPRCGSDGDMLDVLGEAEPPVDD